MRCLDPYVRLCAGWDISTFEVGGMGGPLGCRASGRRVGIPLGYVSPDLGAGIPLGYVIPLGCVRPQGM